MDGGCYGVGEGHGGYGAQWQTSGSEQYRHAISYCSFHGHRRTEDTDGSPAKWIPSAKTVTQCHDV